MTVYIYVTIVRDLALLPTKLAELAAAREGEGKRVAEEQTTNERMDKLRQDKEAAVMIG